MLFQEMLLDFFIYETLLGHCGFKIAVVEFVYPVLFFLRKPYYPSDQIILSRFLSNSP